MARFAQPYEHKTSSTQTKSIEDMERGGLQALKRGVKHWIPDVVGFPGDIADALAYAGRQIVQGQKQRSVPSLGAGAALRRIARERMGEAPATRATRAELSEAPETDLREEAVRFANPLFFMNPKTAVSIAGGALGGVPMGALGVIKNKGGNWLNGSVEDALRGLKKFPRQYSPEEWAKAEEILRKSAAGEIPGVDTAASTRNLNDFLGKRALDSFIDKQLTRYVKNEMATPEDPIRALAERGVLHFDPNAVAEARRTVHPSGEAFQTLGQSPLAKAWEQTSDRFIAPETAGRFKVTRGQDGTTTMSRNPWLEKLPNDATVYDLYESSRPSQLGFSHLTDELANALNPESGLPRHLLLDPKSIDRVSVPQAVERVSQINAWRAAQKAEADAARANNAATVLHKEYPVSDYWHGGDYVPGSDLTRPLYVAKNKALAESYVGMSKDRTGKGSLVPLSHSAKSPAPEDVVVEEARKLGIDVDNYTPASIFDSELHGEGVVSALVRRLKAKGYDSANLHDIGYGTQVDDVATVLFPGVKTNKGYDNPKELRWVELRAPEGMPEGWQVVPESNGQRFIGPNGNMYSKEQMQKVSGLQDALKYEGDTMGHCVGGYCDDVLSGRSQIFSLRDAKGQPHVTIEVAPPSTSEHVDSNIKVNRIKELLGDRYQEYLYKRGFPKYQGSTALEILEKEYPDVYTAYKAELPEQPPRIVQIKGKQNRAPNPEYLPFVQDFVKSGKWSDVGDLQNTGLVDISQYPKRVEKLGNRYVTEEQLNDYLDSFMPAKPQDGYAQGGPVQTKPFTAESLRGIIGQLRQEHSNA